MYFAHQAFAGLLNLVEVDFSANKLHKIPSLSLAPVRQSAVGRGAGGGRAARRARPRAARQPLGLRLQSQDTQVNLL